MLVVRYTYHVGRGTFEFTPENLREHVRRCALSKEYAQAEDDARNTARMIEVRKR